MIYQGTARHPVTEIIVHCADTRPGCMEGRPIGEKVAEIRRWHVEERGWYDIGYHWAIDRDGAVAPGRRETEIRTHSKGTIAGLSPSACSADMGLPPTIRSREHLRPRRMLPSSS
jgi:N-acetylmuramoyl-L-alanine amidase